VTRRQGRIEVVKEVNPAKPSTPTIGSHACVLKLNQLAFSPASDPLPPAGGCTRCRYAVPPEIVTRTDATHAEMQPGRIGFERDQRHCYGRRGSFGGATSSCKAGWARPLACRCDGKSSLRQRMGASGRRAGHRMRLKWRAERQGAAARRMRGDGEGIGRFEKDRQRCYRSFGDHHKNPIGQLKRKKHGWPGCAACCSPLLI
jgi:hypothetical protein